MKSETDHSYESKDFTTRVQLVPKTVHHTVKERKVREAETAGIL
jgi:hypothetical protein